MRNATKARDPEGNLVGDKMEDNVKTVEDTPA